MLLISLVLAAATAFAAAEPSIQIEDYTGAPTTWIQGKRANPHARLDLTVALRNDAAGIARLERELLARSDPTNAKMYGNFLSKDAVDALVAPSPDAVGRVLAWVHANAAGAPDTVTITQPSPDFITVTNVTVAAAERLLRTQYFEYRHVGGKHAVVRAGAAYYAPRDVSFVGPTVRFPAVQRRRTRRSSPADDGANKVTPSTLRAMYNADGAQGKPGTTNLQAVAAFLDNHYSPGDLKQFLAQYSSGARVTEATAVGPNPQGDAPSPESALDTEYLMGVAVDVPTQFWSTPGAQPGNPENEPFASFLAALAKVPDAQAPRTVSVSYGDAEDGVDAAYAKRVNVEFMKAGARGISLVFSSGDAGVGGGKHGCARFVPHWPASSPWVTAVGATTGPGGSEVCADFSGGGFSEIFDQPKYQADAVSGYLSKRGLPSSSYYNASGRGYPDVSAQGEGFVTVWNGLQITSAGTSASAPTFSGIVSLLNERRLGAGKSGLGFLNPMLYNSASSFNDITSGSNPGCGTQGFPAARGWDPVSGLGTPDFSQLATVVDVLPAGNAVPTSVLGEWKQQR